MKCSRRLPAASLLVVVFAVGSLLGGCGDDVAFRPKVITVADLEGTWIVRQYDVTKANDPKVSLRLIEMGGEITFKAESSGTFTGNAFLPQALGGPEYLDLDGAIQLTGLNTLKIDYNQDVPTLLVDFSGPFTLVADTLTINNANALYDFDFNGTKEQALLQGLFVRTERPIEPNNTLPQPFQSEETR
jgi:hypothetical protein